jgi:stage V sporulation protein R
MGSRPGVINPYKVGLELFRDIEERWDKGKFGKDYDECTDVEAKRRWNKELGLGREKIFEVRKIYNDVSFIDTFLTQEFCDEHKLFTYGFDPTTNRYVILDRDHQRVKEKLLFQLTNFGDPLIHVVESNYENRGELFLVHEHEGIDLRVDYAKDVLIHLQKVWSRPVHIETIVQGEPKILSFDGKDHEEKKPEKEVAVTAS